MADFFRKLKDTVLRSLGIHEHLSSEAYIDLARKKGCKIGDGTEFTGVNKLDLTRPSLITIGENCVLTDRVRLLLHTWDDPLLQRRFSESEETPKKLALKPIEVGDNVFIGENTIVLPGVTIGSNVIIGAGSVVSTDIPEDCVAVGNPCAPIMSLDDYRKKRVSEEPEMISTYVRRCQERNIEPDPDLYEFIQSQAISSEE